MKTFSISRNLKEAESEGRPLADAVGERPGEALTVGDQEAAREAGLVEPEAAALADEDAAYGGLNVFGASGGPLRRMSSMTASRDFAVGARRIVEVCRSG